MEYIPAKHLVIRSKSTEWFGTDHTMNIYKGCCHGCIYCDSRSECYGVEDFDTVRAKENALTIIRDDLQRKVRSGIIGTGAMSDPYNPFEKELLLTRHALELIDAYQFGVAIATKSDLITRDIDILQSIKSHSPVICKLTVTTTDDVLAAKVEPRAPSSTRRLAAIKALSGAGLFAGVLLMPTLPFLEDSVENVISVVEAAADAGARFIYPAFGMTLRQNQREYFLSELERCFPGEGLRARYERQYGAYYQCISPNAKILWAAFTKRCGELGLLYEMKHITSAYQCGYRDLQLSFFE
ncbi:Radical SAM domain protein [uncultured Eubacteriales bacterium]|uniref:Radical SAM domain protein n=1 Tax=uncultured Eubacteriales bacterium TaxID=172733 RepID=A0A212K5D9_9FIRM|nr:Radical SAM domain protein [uncultured Eubacteriales bacterium]